MIADLAALPELGDQVRDRRGQREVAALDALEHRRDGELLADRHGDERLRRADRASGGAIGEAELPVERHDAARARRPSRSRRSARPRCRP